MTNVSLPISILFMLSGMIFTAGGFYLLTTHRMKKLEDASDARSEQMQDVAERLVRIETLLDHLKNKRA